MNLGMLSPAPPSSQAPLFSPFPKLRKQVGNGGSLESLSLGREPVPSRGSSEASLS